MGPGMCGDDTIQGYEVPLLAPLPKDDQEEDGREKLAIAVASGHVELVQELLEAGVTPLWAPTHGEHRGYPPLHVAVRGTRPPAILRILLERAIGEDPIAFQTYLQGALHAWTTAFVSLTEQASMARAKFKLLLEFNVDVNQPVEHSGETALHTATRAFVHYRDQAGKPGQRGDWARSRAESAQFKFTLLLHARSDPDLKTRGKYESALDIAGHQYKRELLVALEQQPAESPSSPRPRTQE